MHFNDTPPPYFPPPFHPSLHPSFHSRLTVPNMLHHQQNGAVMEPFMYRELEKERIRAEIIAEEMLLRRRILEEEVRRELLLERHLALRFGPNPNPMRYPPRAPLLGNPDMTPNTWRRRRRRGDDVHVASPQETPQQERAVAVREEKTETGSGTGTGTETLPFQRDPEAGGSVSGGGVKLKEIKDAPTEVNKDNVILLAKPNVNPFDLKRKAIIPPAEDETALGLAISKKPKATNNWTCTLCHVTATSEQGYTEHLRGRKHKARERGLVSHKVGFGVGPLPYRPVSNLRKPINITETTNAPILETTDEKAKANSSSMPSENDEVSKQKTPEDKTQNPVAKENGDAAASKPKKKFRFWCETCQVGSQSLKTIDEHKRGKRHLAKLSKSKLSGPAPEKKKEAVVAVREIKQETVADQMENKVVDTEMITVENKVEGIESVDGDVMVKEMLTVSPIAECAVFKPARDVLA